MIFDKTLQFSDAQAVTASAASTNIIDLRALGIPYGDAAALSRDIGLGKPLPILVQLVETFTLLTSLTFVLQSDEDVAFGSAMTVYTSRAVPLAELIAGRTLNLVSIPPRSKERYMRLFYTVGGSNAGAGKITAGIVMGVQTNGVTFI